jgi:hypothetical protein
MSRYEAQVETIIHLVTPRRRRRRPAGAGDRTGPRDEVQRNQMTTTRQGFTGFTSGNIPGAEVGQEFGETSTELIRRGTSIASTMRPRPGINEAAGQTVGLGPSPCTSLSDPVGGSELPRRPMADWQKG